jgi:hypothetical protein
MTKGLDGLAAAPVKNNRPSEKMAKYLKVFIEVAPCFDAVFFSVGKQGSNSMLGGGLSCDLADCPILDLTHLFNGKRGSPLTIPAVREIT